MVRRQRTTITGCRRYVPQYYSGIGVYLCEGCGGLVCQIASFVPNQAQVAFLRPLFIIY